jgi:hypothetical protein
LKFNGISQLGSLFSLPNSIETDQRRTQERMAQHKEKCLPAPFKKKKKEKGK